MLLILSPAKTIDTKINNVNLYDSKLTFESETKELVSILKEFSIDELSRLMKISDKLAILNYDRYRNFYNDSNKLYTALLAFKGEVYRGIHVAEFNNDDFKYADKVLRILSGLYGVLKPLDKIREYRLEMGTAFQNEKGKDLYEFWEDKITIEIMNSIENSPGEKVLINLASKEYSSALDLSAIERCYKVISINFLEYKNGKHKMVTVYAKKARGLMTGYIIKNKISNLEGIKEFSLGGYCYNDTLSKEKEFVFTR